MKTVLITGANKGIGLAFVKHYVSQKYNVIGTSRTPNPELAQLCTNLILDVSSPTSISDFPMVEKIDILINNAGILHRDKLDSVTSESMLDQFKTNTIGPLLVSKKLLPNMNPDSKIINITSSMGSIEENTSGNYYGYRASKAALNMVTKSMALDLKPRGITVVAIHPGYIQTSMTNGNGEMKPDEAVKRMTKLIDELGIENTGEYRHRDGRIIPY